MWTHDDVDDDDIADGDDINNFNAIFKCFNWIALIQTTDEDKHLYNN